MDLRGAMGVLLQLNHRIDEDSIDRLTVFTHSNLIYLSTASCARFLPAAVNMALGLRRDALRFRATQSALALAACIPISSTKYHNNSTFSNH